MQKKIVGMILCAILVSGGVYAQLKQSPEGLKLENTIRHIKSLYVEDVDSKKLAEAAIRAMLSELDPHSAYLDEEAVKALNEPLQGNFDGIGISFNMLTDTLYVMEVISGGPSQSVGIMPGDKIIYVDGKLIAGVEMNNHEVVKMLRGPKGSTVNVMILRRGVADLIEFRIIRDKIPIISIDASYMVGNDVGYIRLSRFGLNSAEEFIEAERALRLEGMEHLIVDLTDNGGGILQIASDIADEFLEDGREVVYTEGRNQPRYTLKATGGDQLHNGRLVILVNSASASASEILAGAIQDWDRGVVVGRRTFGKGLVQRQLPLPDGTMIRLTVARYYTPSGRSIQRPYKDGDGDLYNQDFIRRYNSGELFDADSIHLPDSLKYETLINRRTVYGGGGIMPDYFVPIDTTRSTPLHSKLNAMGVINRVAIDEVDNNRSELIKLYPDLFSFKENYQISEVLKSKLKAFAANSEIDWNEDQFNHSQSLIFVQLKALIARDLYGSSAFYSIINEVNDIYRKALEIITDERQCRNLLNEEIQQ